jgi:Family of unknown function (DUF6152)
VKRHPMIQPAVTALMICVAASSALAHHSHLTFYDPCKPVTIEGRIESMQWKDPHIQLDLTLDDGRTYHAEWISLREVTTRAGIGPAQTVLTSGTRVVIMGNPLRDAAQIRATVPDYKGDTRGPNLVDVAQMRRADNSWSWRGENLPACTRQ